VSAFLTLLLWIASTAIAFVGAWFVKFTRDDPARPGHLELTRAGWYTLPLASALFILGLGLQIRDQRHAAATEKENRASAQKIDQMQTENHALTQTVAEMNGNVKRMGIGLEQILANSKDAQAVLAANPKIASDVRAAVDASAGSDPSMQTIKEQLQRFLSGDLIKTPLETATDAKDTAAVKAELSRGADPNASGDEGTPPLSHAALVDDLASAKALLASGADVNGRSVFTKQTPLFGAHSVAMADFLLAHGAAINAVDKEGDTPLSFVSIPPTDRMVRYYVGHGANINTATKRGESALSRLTTRGTLEEINLLLNAGADPNFGPNSNVQTAVNELMQLYPCPKADRLPILSTLISHGARCDLRDQYGTPLDRATARHCQAFVDILKHCVAAPR
jgi:ankyrin repeat protein